jgi:HK97 family phage prohead protease
MRIKSCNVAVKAAGEQDGTDDGVFEAIVATWDLDSYGDKIVKGAFADTLAEWKDRGDPIPVIWSHMAHDPDMHLGVVEEAEERDEGLWVKARMDLDQPKAAQVYRLLKGRRVTQFSFAFDVQEGGYIEKQDDDGHDEGYYELRKLKLYEVGPCLVGVNQETELLSVKTAAGRELRIDIHGKHTPAEGELIELAVKTALGAKAGRVLSAKNEEALRGALDKISAGASDVKSVLAALSKDDEDGKAAPVARKDEQEAKPGQPAAVEEPPAAKTSEPAGPRPASLRLRADLAAFAAEVDSLTI